jgi:hypothetical protein
MRVLEAPAGIQLVTRYEFRQMIAEVKRTA